ncbi:MAG TPA: threonine synthase [Dongiaceae bacterium]|nr:threonine synthase [Dongiaceae bacterium]
MTLLYESSRGRAPVVAFEDSLLAGLAQDGGLYVPCTWPLRPAASYRGRAYASVAADILETFSGRDDSIGLAKRAYQTFRHQAVAPLRQIDAQLWLMELFHGPTFAFKDIALQLLGQLYQAILAERGARVTILGATSGDTGSAAIEAFRGKPGITVFMLHPRGRISEIQRRQMTHVTAGNIFNIAIEGTFDDCQNLVKKLFADAGLREEVGLTAVNSINWARIAAQIVYYFAGCAALGEAAFAVPSGNFGNVYAGYAAHEMGAPIFRLIVGTNRNDALATFFKTGRITRGPVHATLSPSMDIQIPSNLERLLFGLCGRDGAGLAERLAGNPEDYIWDKGEVTNLFAAHAIDDETTLDSMRAIYRHTGEIIDPHTAVGIAAARQAGIPAEIPIIALATAHPAKFSQAVKKALGREPPMPEALAALTDLPERYVTLANDSRSLTDFVRHYTEKS